VEVTDIIPHKYFHSPVTVPIHFIAKTGIETGLAGKS
jgi:hypothetical protein